MPQASPSHVSLLLDPGTHLQRSGGSIHQKNHGWRMNNHDHEISYSSYKYIYKWLSHTMTMEKNLSGAGQLKHVETVNTLGDASNMFKYSNSSIHF